MWDRWDIRLGQNQSWVKAICLACIIACCCLVGLNLMTKANPDARESTSIGPRLLKPTCPHAPLLPLGFGLGRCVAAFAILGPVERRPTDGAHRHRALS